MSVTNSYIRPNTSITPTALKSQGWKNIGANLLWRLDASDRAYLILDLSERGVPCIKLNLRVHEYLPNTGVFISHPSSMEEITKVLDMLSDFGRLSKQ